MKVRKLNSAKSFGASVIGDDGTMMTSGTMLAGFVVLESLEDDVDEPGIRCHALRHCESRSRKVPSRMGETVKGF
ncbi:unnamed protein product [Bursaphelenchus xylophilus]|uniref:(pine wood nematode) hypothetical protein n=1 Tax=Bursaphelenchus xylophilus TaxID=6326 RepID=A0A7I8WFN5_BURXY|nr:unnamed protein product [Bursaphelenchus xylophilus]CAG9111999.1 unnamed protein product [Bursaphelenchus xylophilus]